MVEPDADNEYSRRLWLEDTLNDEEFLADMDELIKKWKSGIAVTANPDKLDIHIVGQSHIDMAWLWRYEQTHQKGLKTFQKAVLHGKLVKDFCYAASEPCLFWWAEKDDPKTLEDVKAAVKAGNIELVGGSWVEPDCMMPSGEAFCRQRLYGMKYFNDHFGILPTVEWFLDSFGYNVGLPQILKKSGAKYFWTSKITWNRQTVFPFVNFWWEGPDGTQLLTSNFQQNWAPIESWMRFEIGRHPIRPDGQRIWSYKDDYDDIADNIDEDPDNIIPPVGIFHGKGDGGHGPTHQEVAEDVARVKLGFGKWSRSENFFKALEPYGEKLPVWQDELYLEYHRGTFTVHWQVKKHNRYFEHKLVASESLAAMTALVNNDYLYPFEEYQAIWREFLLNQFHDCLPGSSIPEVYDDLYDTWLDFSEKLDKIIKNWSTALAVPEKTEIILSNPVAWSRKSPVFIPITEVSKIRTITLDSNGKPPYIQLIRADNPSEVLIGQPIAAEKGDSDDTRPAGWYTIVELNALATKCYSIQTINPSEIGSINTTSFTVKGNEIKGSGITIKISPTTGALTHWAVELVNNNQNLIKGESSNLADAYLDDFPQDHAWNIKPEYWKYPLVLNQSQNVQLKVVENGPIFLEFDVIRTYGDSAVKEKLKEHEGIGGPNKVVQRHMLFKDDPKLYLTYEADWKQPWVMLKVRYDTATGATSTTSDQMYCALERSTVPKSPCDKARYEKIMHNYADLSTPDCKWGIALLNEGKYAYDTEGFPGNEPKPGTMRLTLLRTAQFPKPSAESWANEERKIRLEKTGEEVPKFIDLGFFRCRYALYPHLGGALITETGKPNSQVKRAGEEFNVPILVQAISKTVKNATSSLVNGSPLLTVEPAHVLVTSVKQKEWDNSKNTIIRVVETSGVSCAKVTITLDQLVASKIKTIQQVDILERNLGKSVVFDKTTHSFTFAIGKFEILTFELIQ
jgi:alpha-mannosidase